MTGIHVAVLRAGVGCGHPLLRRPPRDFRPTEWWPPRVLHTLPDVTRLLLGGKLFAKYCICNYRMHVPIYCKAIDFRVFQYECNFENLNFAFLDISYFHSVNEVKSYVYNYVYSMLISSFFRQ